MKNRHGKNNIQHNESRETTNRISSAAEAQAEGFEE